MNARQLKLITARFSLEGIEYFLSSPGILDRFWSIVDLNSLLSFLQEIMYIHYPRASRTTLRQHRLQESSEESFDSRVCKAIESLSLIKQSQNDSITSPSFFKNASTKKAKLYETMANDPDSISSSLVL